MSGIGESRTDLLIWLNDLLQLNYKRVEECGTGAAYCQIMDSIYGDVPMHRVRFESTAEYEYQTNYKILQSCFAKHKIEKTVYVDKLLRCKFQDNLEFLQWIKRFWAQNKDDTPYDPSSRRRYRPVTSGNNIHQAGPSQPNSSNTSTPGVLNISKRKSAGYIGLANKPSRNSSEQLVGLQAELSQSHATIRSLENDMDTLKETVSLMENERDFYYTKLRDIEILVQTTQDLITEGLYGQDPSELEKFLSKIQKILYATGNEGEGQNNRETLISEDANNVGIISNDIIGGNAKPNLIVDDETF